MTGDMQQVTHAEVLSFALAECGMQHPADQVESWLSGDTAGMPDNIEPVLDAIFANIDYYTALLQQRLLLDGDIVDEGLRAIASLPPSQLKAKVIARRDGLAGEVRWYCRDIKMPLRTKSTMSTMAKALKLSNQAFLELFLESTMDAIRAKTRGVDATDHGKWLTLRRSLTSHEVRNTIRRCRRAPE